MNAFDVLIFDLGGVIINLRMQDTFREMAKLADLDETAILKEFHENPVFKAYEMGKIGDDEFRKGIRKIANNENLSNKAIDQAWNAMLGDIPKKRIEAIASLRKKYPVHLLSNTNKIHIEAFHRILQSQCDVPHLNSVFERVFLSYEMDDRKPNESIFQQVVKDLGVSPGRCLFLDDTLENIEAAHRVGLQTYHVRQPDDWLSVLL